AVSARCRSACVVLVIWWHRPSQLIVFCPSPSPQRVPSFPFFLNDTATTEIYTLSLHDALPIYRYRPRVADRGPRQDHDLPGRRRPGNACAFSRDRAPWLREVLRGPPPPGNGGGARATLRHVSGEPSRGRLQWGRSAF